MWIAYQAVGEGEPDIAFVPGFISNVELRWRVPSFAAALRRMASGSRLILFDKRGTGMSDRVAGVPTLETRIDDLRAVLDAVGSRRAVIFGVSEGVPMSLLFAATHPDRTAALVLRGGYPRARWAPDHPWGRTDAALRDELDRQLRIFGPRAAAMEAVRSLGRWIDAEVPGILDYLRQSASPGAVEALAAMNRDIDVRHVLPAIRVPTLILHGTEDDVVPIEVAREMAGRIPGARLVELPGAGHLHFGRDDPEVEAALERLIEEVRARPSEEPGPERVLATVLFTDIVGSTERAAAIGDHAWRDLLQRHHAIVREQLSRHRGREVDTSGDGFFAAFDGPARAIRCGRAIAEAVGRLGLEVRVGLHTGECEVIEGKVTGIAVHIGARVARLARPGEVLVSGTVRDLVAGSGITFADRGEHELKGIPGTWRLFSVAPGDAP